MSDPLRIVFAGTPEFACLPLQSLLDHGYSILAVYTQPDRPAGRGQRLMPSPVKNLALQHKLHVEQPENFKFLATKKTLAKLNPDVMIVVAYGLLLPKSVLNMPKFGCINIHASLLPRWRGAAPIQRAILAGDTETGISIMQMEVKLDTGPVIHQIRCPIMPTDTSAILHDRLSSLGAKALLEILPHIIAGTCSFQPQDFNLVVFAAKLEKSEANLDWQQPAQILSHQVRAFNPWPIAQARYAGQVIRIWEAHMVPGQAPAGIVVAASAIGIDVGTIDGLLRITKLQLPNRRVITALDFINTHDLTGARFE